MIVILPQFRNLKKKLMKRDLWPRDYIARIRVKDPKTNEEIAKRVCILLPHELVECMAKAGDLIKLQGTNNLDAQAERHRERCRMSAGKDLVALGIWTDGLPCNWDRTASLVTVTMSFPGLEGKWANLRLIQNYILMCFFVFPKGLFMQIAV